MVYSRFCATKCASSKWAAMALQRPGSPGRMQYRPTSPSTQWIWNCLSSFCIRSSPLSQVPPAKGGGFENSLYNSAKIVQNVMECTRLLYRICAEKASAPRGGRNFRPANAARGKYYLRREERRMQKALAFHSGHRADAGARGLQRRRARAKQPRAGYGLGRRAGFRELTG